MNIKENITTINQFKGRFGKKIEALVIHSTWGTYHGSIQWFKNPKAEASAHYVVKRDGEITLCVPEDNAAWHTGLSNRELAYALGLPSVSTFVKKNVGTNLNWLSLGIEMEDNKNKNWDYPSPQYAAVVELTADICKRHNLTVDREHILMHKEINPMNRTDPVGKWNHDKFINDVRIKLGMKPSGDSRKIWKLRSPLTIKVTAVYGLNVRTDANTAGERYGLLRQGFDVAVKGWCDGQEVSGNKKWWLLDYKDKEVFIWSGGTSLVPTDSLKGNVMNVTEYNEAKAKLEEKGKALEEEFGKLRDDKFALVTRESDLSNKKNQLDEEWAALASEEPKEEVVAEVVSEVVAEAPVEEVKIEGEIDTDAEKNAARDMLAKLEADVKAFREKYGL